MHAENASRAGNVSPRHKIFKMLGAGIIGVLILLLGIGIGNGTVGFGTSAPNSHNKNLPADLDYADVEELYDILKAKYDGKLEVDTLLDGLKAGLAEAAGDPYTQYFNSEDAKDFNAQLTGSFTGIGAELGSDEDDNLIIVAPIDGFPASKAGLRAQDVIVSINGKSTADMSVYDAVGHIRGEKGTEVTLRILRNDKEDLTFKITREVITVPSVKSEILDENIGYLQITQFNQDTTGLVTQAAEEFVRKGVKGVVLDLRDDPGGLLNSAIDVSSLWLPDGKTILKQKQGGVVTDTYTASGKAPLQGMPTAVLINAGSASASEIVAGALRDNKVATLYGEKSYGKGSVQEIHELPGGAEIKVTIARWYRPNGQNIDKKGIKPDKEVKMTEDDYKQKRDPQKDAAVNFVKSQ